MRFRSASFHPVILVGVAAQAVSQSEIEDFLGRFRGAQAKQTAVRAQELADELARIRPNLAEAKRRRAEHARDIAPDFNVFHVLGLTHSESAHSNFLGELLDPRCTQVRTAKERSFKPHLGGWV
jgi:hypothetical protein